jgi:nitrous oxidase accessory protein NosD
MSGDYSRKRFHPHKHFSGVLKQQGRVDLDSDWNENSAIQDRRWRAETVDVVGRCGVPDQTPNGFRIINNGGVLEIGLGRMYVDGLLAENHGQLNPDLPASPPAQEFNAVLSELRSTENTPFEDQPYVPDPVSGTPAPGPVLVDTAPAADPPLLTGVPPAGQALAILDVWQREVTHLQDPELVEVAVGVDTTTRYQTVWQVKLLAADDSVTCETPDEDIAGWLDILRPSDARLTNMVASVPPAEDLCQVPPDGQYRGTENHLYRVEVHDVDGDVVRVKWSRENAAVASTVTTIVQADQLVIESLGRDDILRFKTGDWVEVTDDRRELLGLPGEMRQITVEDTTRTLTFNPPLDTTDFPSDANGVPPADRHMRVIRWDQAGSVRRPDETVFADVDSTGGLIQLTAADNEIILENGIAIRLVFAAGDKVNNGDYWCFAARTADADFERLSDAPPLGMHHHYCRLAVVGSDGVAFTGDPEDCRPVFPPLTEIYPGCCTVVVRPGENIQQALDSLPESGGCVCLKTGEHEIRTPLRIESSNIEFHGETLGARVVRRTGAELLVVEHPADLLLENIVVSNIQLEFDNTDVDVGGLSPLIDLSRCENAALERCTLTARRLETLVGVRVRGSTAVRMTECALENLRIGLWVATDSTALAVLDNVFESVTDNNTDGGVVGLWLDDAFGASRIERNTIRGYLVGVALNRNLFEGVPSSGAVGSVIAENRIFRASTELDSGDRKSFGIEVAANRCVILDNIVTYAVDALGGIAVASSDCRVEGNRIENFARVMGESPPVGILLGVVGVDQAPTLVKGVITGNRISGPQHAIVVIENSGAEISNNRIDSLGTEAGFAVGLLQADRCRVRGNLIINAAFGITVAQGEGNSVVDNEVRDGGAGMTAVTQTSFEFTGNRVENMRDWGFLGFQCIAKMAVTENRILSCGYSQTQKGGIGIGVSQLFGELHIESNEVMNTGISPDGTAASQLAFGVFADLVLECRMQSNLVTYSNPGQLDLAQEHRALWLRGFIDFAITTGHEQLTFGFSAQVLDNKFFGPGFTSLVEFAQQRIGDSNNFRRFERVFFNNNFCWHASSGADASRATVTIVGRSAIVMGNHIKASTPFFSVDFNNVPGVFMGNITQRGTLNFSAFPNPESDFNRQ